MANKKIDELLETLQLDESSYFVVTYKGETKKISYANLDTLVKDKILDKAEYDEASQILTLTFDDNSNLLADFTSLAKKTDIPKIDDTMSSSSTNPVQNKIVLAEIAKAGHNIDIVMDSTNYKVTFNLRDKERKTISTAELDLPLEATVVSGRYDNATKELILILRDKTEIKIPVGDLINGLVSDKTFNATVNEINGKIADLISKHDKDVANINKELKTHSDDIGNNTKRVKDLEKNIFDNGEAQGETINIKDSALGEFQEVSMKIDKAQESTSGYNLCNVREIIKTPVAQYRPIVMLDYKIEKGEIYTFSMQLDNSNKDVYFNLVPPTCLENLPGQPYPSFTCVGQKVYMKLRATETKQIENIGLICSKSEGNNAFNITDIFCYKGTDKKPYEPYTGGMPSPNPEFPQEIKSIKKEWNVTSCGKNLFDVNKITPNIIKVNGAIEENAYWRMGEPFIKVQSNKDMTISWKSNSNYFQCNIALYDSNKNIIKVITYGEPDIYKKTFNTENASYIRFCYSISVSGKDAPRENIQIEKGTQATSYEPYQSISNKTTLQGNEFLPEDEYIIKFDEEKGEYWKYLKKNIKKFVFDGDEDFQLQSINSHGIANFLFRSYFNNVRNFGYCNNFTLQNSLIANETNPGFLINENDIFFRMKQEEASTISEFKKWLSTHNTELIYRIKIPELIPIEKVNTMNMTYYPETNVFNSIDNLNTSVKYYRAFDNTIKNIENKITENANSINAIKAEQTTQNEKIATNTNKNIEQDKELESIKSNLINLSSTKAEEIQVNDSSDLNARISVYGNTKQESTKGYNIFNFKKWYDQKSELAVTSGKLDKITENELEFTPQPKADCYTNTLVINTTQENAKKYIDKYGFEVEEKDYIMKLVNNTEAKVRILIAFYDKDYNYLELYDYMNKTSKNIREGFKPVPKSKYALIRFGCFGETKQVKLNDISIVLLENENAPYEPYTGGQASPNPSYPQEVESVKGNIEIKQRGKNLFDKNKISQNSYVSTSDGRVFPSDVQFATDYIDVANMEKIISNFYSNDRNNLYGYAYDKNKKPIIAIGKRCKF